jgi:formylglycine-generating enzyme required for sulfatase activity
MDLRKIQYEETHKRKKKSGVLRTVLIVISTIIITSIAVNATDNIGDLKNSFVGSAIEGVMQTGGGESCESGMVFVSSPDGGFCIDQYEVSAGEGCLYSNPGNAQESHSNLNTSDCKVVSREGSLPWTNISHAQALEACASVGKHLPSNKEWFLASLGTRDQSRDWDSSDCNVNRNWNGNQKGMAGSGGNCISGSGAYDMIGNVWEWTYETVAQGTYKGIDLPSEGYVASVNEEGIPTETSEEASNLFYEDRFWIDEEKHTGIIRGGYWGSESDAGRFAVHSEIPPTFTGAAVGFRCAK